MLIESDCIPCILNMSLNALRKAVNGPDEEKVVFEKVLHIPALRGESWNMTSAEVVEQVMKIIADYTREADPFLKDKVAQNKKLLEIYPSLQEMVNNSDEPLFTAVKLAILGNAIDAMVSNRPSDMIQGMRARLEEIDIRKADYAMFVERLEQCNLLVYLADNAGEAVLDKLFIETAGSRYELNVYYVVRSLPALNDVTEEDAKDVGMEAFAHVVGNGIDGPLPGTLLGRCSREVQSLIEEADLIISKGGGNFETFSERMPSNKPVTFMLLSKCPVYHRHFGVPLNSPILANHFQRGA